MDITIIVAMVTPVVLLLILTPIFYTMKLKRDYERKKNLKYIPLEDATNVINQILDQGEKGRSYVIFSAKESEYYVQYGYEDNGFILYFFKSPIFTEIHFSKFKNILINHNFKQVEDKPIELLEIRQFLELNGGFNVCVGTEIKEIYELTKEILEKVFEEPTLEVNVESEL